MRELHIPFDHIENNWTDRQYFAVIDRINESNKKQKGNTGFSGILKSMKAVK